MYKILAICVVLIYFSSASPVPAVTRTDDDGLLGVLKAVFDKIINGSMMDASQMDCKNTTQTKDLKGGQIQTNGTTCIGKGNNTDVVYESVSSNFQISSENSVNHNQTKEMPPPSTGE